MATIILNPIIDPSTGQPYADQTPHRGDTISMDIQDLPNKHKNSAVLFVAAQQGEDVVWNYIAYGGDQGHNTTGPSINAPFTLDTDSSSMQPWNISGGPAEIIVSLRSGIGEVLATFNFPCLDLR
jgi:hypothetical protein